ncbi:hypothetical protein [Kiloniella sp.]|uniref:hypothetical protein n=1 Tax=Kiloniella sp. TaxID=1938587 RepID=UPI003B02C940
MSFTFFVRLLFCVGIVGFSTMVQAQGLSVEIFEGNIEESTSNNRILLVIDGEKRTKFRLSDLEKITLYEIKMPPIWKGEDGKYQGVLLKDIMALVGVTEAKTVRLVAIDGYVIDLEKKIWQSSCSFIATRHKKQEISIDKKGPTRLLLPCSVLMPDYEDTGTSDWIWNLKEIHIQK